MLLKSAAIVVFRKNEDDPETCDKPQYRPHNSPSLKIHSTKIPQVFACQTARGAAISFSQVTNLKSWFSPNPFRTNLRLETVEGI